MVLTGKIEVGEEPTLVVAAPDESIRLIVRIDPDGDDGDVFIGDEAVSESTGFLLSGQVESFGTTIANNEQLYACVAAAADPVTVIYLAVRQ